MPEPAAPLRLGRLLPPQACAGWAARAGDCAAALPLQHPDRQPTSGSLRLLALGPRAFDALLRAVTCGAAGAELRCRLGPQPLCLRAQCWLRRQHPAGLRPAGEHPHQWHQDGALGCRFDGRPELLAPLLTLWMPLVDCGDDAPSIEWTEPVPQHLLQPPELAATAAATGPDAPRRHTATLAAGEGLLFGAALLHRTHVTPSMTRSRISAEWRFVAAGSLPPRLAAEALCTLEGAGATSGSRPGAGCR